MIATRSIKEISALLICTIIVTVSCDNKNAEADAFGNFLANEVIISSETSGRIVGLNLSEGDYIKEGVVVVVIDSVQYWLKIKELSARKKAAEARKPTISAQVSVYQQQRNVLEKDLTRVEEMLKDGAATRKQFDDLAGKINVLDKQIEAVQSNLLGIEAEVIAMEAGLAQAKDMLRRTKILSPINGVVLQKFVEKGELAAPGKALFKIADLTTMELKAFVSGSQLSEFKIGDAVQVAYDGNQEQLKTIPGTVTWVAGEAEFTPKNIQTREERLSQVYAIKVTVENAGEIKINMPGEVRFNSK